MREVKARFKASSKLMKTLLPCILLMTISAAHGAVVLDNLSNAATTSILVKGTGGFIPTAQEYGFEFTVGGGDHYLQDITLSIGIHLGTLPLTVELYESPSGPDSATFLTVLTGPAQPVNQLASFAPPAVTTLLDGETYFVRLWVNGNASSYGINETAPSATGIFTLGNNFQRTAGSSWGAGDHGTEPLVGINAIAVPEPGVTLLGAFGLLLLLRRRL